jgi:DNA-binding NtrC family response regulator
MDAAMTLESKGIVGGNETILVVDDEDAVWDFVIEALQKLGYSVLLAENGLDAVEIYRNNPKQIDLVLLDMIMPKLGGHNTFCELKAIDPNVKTLLSSGFVTKEEVDDLLRQGAKGFLPKPHRLSDLAKEIRRVLDMGK